MLGKDLNLYGFNPVKEAIENNVSISVVFIKRGKLSKEVREIIKLCKEKEIPFIFKEKFYFKKENRNYWIFAKISPVKLLKEEEILKVEEFIIFLYKIQDPQNLGNLLRTISALGFSKVAMTIEETAPLSDVVVNSSEGAINFLKISNIKKPLNFLKKAKEEGFKIYGGTMEGVPIDKANLEEKSILILGSEGKGIPEPIKKICNELVSIPLKGPVRSLNVSTAGGILLYEIRRKLYNSNL